MTRRFPLLQAATLAALVSALAGPAGARIYREVEVQGAKLIPADDIRQTCGDLTVEDLAPADLIEIEDCLMSTGVFERVALRGEGDRLVIAVTETENNPGRIDAGIAWVDDRGLTLSLAYSQFNLIPDTYSSARIDYSREMRGLELGLFRPDAFSPTLGLGFSLDAFRVDYDELSFSKRAVLSEVYLVHRPNDALRLDYGAGYRSHRMFGLEGDASPLLWQEAGAGGIRSESGAFLHLGARWHQGKAEDSRDYHLKLDQYLWNLGRSTAISETRIEAGLRQSLGAVTDLRLRLSAGRVTGTDGNDTSALDRFFIGGADLRGFAPRGVGPADDLDLLGANRYVTGTVEISRDLQDLLEQEISASLFYDFGSAWSLDDSQNGRIDTDAHFRSSLGVAVSFDVGGVPVSLYAATPLKHQPQDQRQVFGLSVAASF